MVSHPILEKVKQKLSCVTVTKASWNIPNPNVWSLLCWQSFSLSFATLFRASETSLVDRSGSGQPNCCKTVQGLRSQILSCSSYIFNCLRCFTMMISIFFRRTAKIALQNKISSFSCLNLTQLEVLKKSGREITGRWNLVICWFRRFLRHWSSSWFVLLSNEHPRQLSTVFPQFSRIGKSVLLC